MVYSSILSINWSNIKRSRYWMSISIKGVFLLRMPDFFATAQSCILHTFVHSTVNAIIKVTSKASLPSYAVWLKVKGGGDEGYMSHAAKPKSKVNIDELKSQMFWPKKFDSLDKHWLLKLESKIITRDCFIC